MKTNFKIITTVLLVLLFIGPGIAQERFMGLSYLEGMRANIAASEIENAGYKFIHTDKSGNAIDMKYWQPEVNRCVSMRIINGTVQGVYTASDGDCNQNQGRSNSSRSSNAAVPRDLWDVMGMETSSSGNAMERNGYTDVSSSRSGGNIYVNYWNPSQKKCVVVRSSNGRVQDIHPVPNSDCNRDRWGNLHHENQRYDTNTERNYHNDRTNRWRHNNDAYHDRNYRYENDEVRVSDIVGRDAEWSYSELRHRGFDEVKKHQEGGKTYRVFYNYRTNQCIKTLSVSKRIQSIQNSTHCNL
ncbi:hypothetical protein [Aegicerativicinus sediminis]|uniref:hypothetical protein n=1 Tax=Aegicerativicinus sediminis TaxID=2893202 RepID=UPI001E39A2F1|nr:hypothetical protein [Aegicerativicinus sediminis]